MVETNKQLKKLIAWGASPLLEIYLKNKKTSRISYCIDSALDKLVVVIATAEIGGYI